MVIFAVMRMSFKIMLSVSFAVVALTATAMPTLGNTLSADTVISRVVGASDTVSGTENAVMIGVVGSRQTDEKDVKSETVLSGDTLTVEVADSVADASSEKQVRRRRATGAYDLSGFEPKPFDSLTPLQQKSYLRQAHRDSIRAHKRVWLSPFGGPSYTPEASFGIGGALLASFRINKNDSVSYRSFLPIGFNVSINGTIVVAGAGTLFFKENNFRIYANYGYRNEPSHYYGKGMETIENTVRGDSTTKFHKEYVSFNPRFVWQLKPHFFLGPVLDINYSRSWNINERMAADPYKSRFRNKYMNVGVGGIVQYDTRDDIATPNKGLYLSATGKVFSRYLGGAYDYQIIDLEYRQYQPLWRRAILAWVVRTQLGFNDIPFTELPSFGSPFDLRGYFLGQYRDRTMAYSIVEYRHMFGSLEDYRNGRFLSKLGVVGWVGTGTIGDTPAEWTKWKLNYGAGLRVQIQPRKNFRLDVGKAHGVRGVQVYLNMTEAF